MNLKGKTVIVTGGSRGIGRSIAEVLAEDGASILICSTKGVIAESVAAEISVKTGAHVLGVQCDVTKESDVKKLMQKAIHEFGKLDALVNNAGITKDNLLLRLSEEDWDDVINTNLKSAFLCSKLALRPMLKNKGGKIIHMASVVGMIGNPGQANYAASKGGLIAFSKSIAKEYATKGIVSHVVAPGFIETDMIESLPEDYLNNIINMVPIRRLGKGREVAYLVSYLISDRSSYMTGQVYQVDGGLAI